MQHVFSQGVILVYDITNRWSFDGIDRWIKEIDEVKHSHTFAFICLSEQIRWNMNEYGNYHVQYEVQKTVKDCMSLFVYMW